MDIDFQVCSLNSLPLQGPQASRNRTTQEVNINPSPPLTFRAHGLQTKYSPVLLRDRPIPHRGIQQRVRGVGFPIGIPLRGISRNCAELHATVLVLSGIAWKLQASQLRASKIHLHVRIPLE